MLFLLSLSLRAQHWLPLISTLNGKRIIRCSRTTVNWPLCPRRDIPTSDFQSRELDDVQDQFERDLYDEEFSMREYSLDERDTLDDLETREPSLFGALTSVASFMCSDNPLNPNFWSYSHIGESAVKDIAKSKLPKIAAKAAGSGKYAKTMSVFLSMIYA